MVSRALEAAENLKDFGISVEIVNPRTHEPLDENTILHSVKKTGHTRITHEAVQKSGFSAEIASILAEKDCYHMKAHVKQHGGEFVPIPSSKKLEKAAVPQTIDIIHASKELMRKSKENRQSSSIL